MAKKYIVFWTNGIRVGSIQLTTKSMSEIKSIFNYMEIQTDINGTIHLELLGENGKRLKITTVARDSENKIMWIKGRTDISPLTYREFNEGRDMTSGSITKDGVKYLPPFTVKEEIK